MIYLRARNGTAPVVRTRWFGVVIRGIAYRCGAESDSAACELPVGHDGPIMPPWRHVGRDGSGAWQLWENA